MDKDLAALHEKIDVLTAYMEETRRRQRELEELRRDLTPIAADLFQNAVTELDEVAPYFNYVDLIFLAKRLLRNTRNFIALFDSMESAADLIRDATPLSKAVFQTTLEHLEEMERRGYFAFFKGALDILDRVVSEFDEEEVRRLGDNIVLILNTVKQLTQPEMMRTLQNALAVFQHLSDTPREKVTLFTLLRELNSPEIRVAMANGLAILKNISAEPECGSGASGSGSNVKKQAEK